MVRQIGSTSNTDSSNVKYLAVAYSNKHPPTFSCPNANTSTVQFYYRFFGPSGWQAAQLFDSIDAYPECVAGGPVINWARPAVGSTVSPNSSLVIAYGKPVGTVGLRINALESNPVTNATSGNWPTLQLGVWYASGSPIGSNQVLPALGYQLGTLGLTWYDDRSHPAGSLGSVHGVSTTTSQVSNFPVNSTQQVAWDSIYAGGHYMGLASWYQKTEFWGASYGNGNLWLQYDSNP